MNVSNKLTISRIILAIIIMLLLMFPWNEIGLTFPSFLVMGKVLVDSKYLVAGFLFLIASFTDYLDGAIARSSKLTSNFGAIMDVFADKILIDGLAIILAYQGFISILVPVVLVISDILTDALRVFVVKSGRAIKSSKLNQFGTLFLLVGLALVLFYNLPFEIWGIYLAEILVDVGMILSLVSSAFYYMDYKDTIKLN